MKRSARLFVPWVAAIRRLASGDEGMGLPSVSLMLVSGRDFSFVGHAFLVSHPIDMVCNVAEESILERERTLQSPCMESGGRPYRERYSGIAQKRAQTAIWRPDRPSRDFGSVSASFATPRGRGPFCHDVHFAVLRGIVLAGFEQAPAEPRRHRDAHRVPHETPPNPLRTFVFGSWSRPACSKSLQPFRISDIERSDEPSIGEPDRRRGRDAHAGSALDSPLKKALLTGFHSTAKHNATKAVSPSSETMRTI